MKREEIVTLASQVEEVVAKYDDVIGTQAAELKHDHAVDDSSELRQLFLSWDQEQNPLRVGIVGRVKAGKSSMLNALFFKGENVLPKAATPMTAALTVLSHGDQFSAEVDFFSADDVADVKHAHAKYREEFDKTLERENQAMRKRAERRAGGSPPDDVEIVEKARRAAERSMKNHPLRAAYDQFERMRNSPENEEGLANRTLSAASVEELLGQLTDYVGAKGAYMPYTKSVKVSIPEESLCDVEVVDTPGLNDPIQSREARTREYLKHCDVVFIVSPAGQFLSTQDTELMDRLASKEGVRHLFLIASQVDMQLLGDVPRKNQGDLDKALQSIAESLGDHARSVLSDLKLSHPEVGDSYDELIREGSGRVLLNSGLCYTMEQSLETGKDLDPSCTHVWNNLKSQYPSYFSDADPAGSSACLAKVANISSVAKAMEGVSQQKAEIIQQKRADLVDQKSSALLGYTKALRGAAETRIKELEDGDVDELQTELENLNKVRSTGTLAVNEEYLELVDELVHSLKTTLKGEASSFFKETAEDIKGAREAKTEEYEVKKSGAISWGARIFGLGGYESRTREVVSVRTGAVKAKLEDLTTEIEGTVEDKYFTQVRDWKKRLTGQLVHALRDKVEDSYLDASAIRSSIRRVTKDLGDFSVNYSDELSNAGKEKGQSSEESEGKTGGRGMYKWFASGIFGNSSKCDLNATGTLTGDSADEFIEAARSFVTNLKKRLSQDISKHCDDLEKTLGKVDIAELVFSDYQTRIESLKKDLEDKTMVVDRLQMVKEALHGIGE